MFGKARYARGPLIRSLIVMMAVLAALTPAAAAHGPCGCLEPTSGPVGTSVSARYPIYKVIFNPDRADLGIGPESLWREHRPGAPVTIYRDTWRYSRKPRNDGGNFRIPAAAPGRYLIALYDGGEGGQHYSWDTFTVTGARAIAPPRDEPEEASWLPAAGAGILALLAGLGIGLALGPRIRAQR